MPNQALTLSAATLILACSSSVTAGPCDVHFPFDGNLADVSGNGYHGLPIIKEGEPSAPRFVEGKIGQALHVTGGNAMRAFIDLHHEFCPQVTVTAWFKLESLDVSGNQYIFSTGGGSGPGIRAQGSTLAMNGVGNGIRQSDAIRDKNTWFFLAGVYDNEAKTYRLYWRNRVVEGQFGDTRREPEDSFWVGTYNDNMSYTAQSLYIDDLRVHGKALTAEELRQVAADTSGAAAAGSAGSNLSSLSAERLTELAQINSGSALSRELVTTLPACETHEDCEAGSYCAWDSTCHPDRHSPKQALTFNVAASQTITTILPEDAPVEDDSGTTPATSGPFGAGEPTFTAVAGWPGGNQRRIDLGEEFLTRIRMERPNSRSAPCRVWANNTELDICNEHAATEPELVDVQLQGSVIGRISVCGTGAIQGMQVWGDVIDEDGTTRYEPAASKDETASCRSLAAALSNVWSASKMCAPDYLGTGIVVHSNDVGVPYEIVTGIQLICRRIGVR